MSFSELLAYIGRWEQDYPLARVPICRNLALTQPQLTLTNLHRAACAGCAPGDVIHND